MKTWVADELETYGYSGIACSIGVRVGLGQSLVGEGRSVATLHVHLGENGKCESWRRNDRDVSTDDCSKISTLMNGIRFPEFRWRGWKKAVSLVCMKSNSKLCGYPACGLR